MRWRRYGLPAPAFFTVSDLSARVLESLRALGADVDRLPEIPRGLAEWIEALTPEAVARIRQDVKELERLGLLPSGPHDSEGSQLRE